MTAFDEAKLIMESSDQNCNRKKLEELKSLLLRHPKLTRQHGENGLTLLHYATSSFAYAFVPLLLEFGADPNSLTPEGRSPLGMCPLPCERDIRACRRMLERAGARLTTKEALGELLVSGKVSEVLEFWNQYPNLLDCFPYPHGHCLHLSVVCSPNAVLVEHLLRHGVDPNVTDKEIHTPLHRASDRRWSKPDEGTERIIDALLRHGADLNRADKDGNTPLHCFARRPWTPRLVYLVSRGAKLNCRNLKGETPLDIVYAMRYPNYRQTASWLKSQGAKRA